MKELWVRSVKGQASVCTTTVKYDLALSLPLSFCVYVKNLLDPRKKFAEREEKRETERNRERERERERKILMCPWMWAKTCGMSVNKG